MTVEFRDCTKLNGYSRSHSPIANYSPNYHYHDNSTNRELSGNNIPRTVRTRWSSGNCESNRCANCPDIVYANERIDAVGKVFHRLCFKCTDCQRLLDRGSACDHNREVFCQNCYTKNFGSKGIKAGTNLRCA
ncbi:Cysteine and glycine-rich protein isoform 2 [Schistosoma japonicum]|uniref:Cysteine and glycine-rich protein isoform 2 n=1 Tax=Schistosoma japonicum TaxID=6182 RepID=A0A4Z2DAA8_SCHJA|nr:Cysteine and glycine-rich protein isoform 2 [Schistosoma japonicum]